MSKTHAEFQDFLMTKLGSPYVYSQPPASVQMHYPAFRFQLADIATQKADNIKYLRRRMYTLTYITEDVDDPMVDEISKWDYCKYDRWYASGNLNHFVYTIYY